MEIYCVITEFNGYYNKDVSMNAFSTEENAKAYYKKSLETIKKEYEGYCLTSRVSEETDREFCIRTDVGCFCTNVFIKKIPIDQMEDSILITH